jgi:hypothetical protein
MRYNLLQQLLGRVSALFTGLKPSKQSEASYPMKESTEREAVLMLVDQMRRSHAEADQESKPVLGFFGRDFRPKRMKIYHVQPLEKAILALHNQKSSFFAAEYVVTNVGVLGAGRLDRFARIITNKDGSQDLSTEIDFYMFFPAQPFVAWSPSRAATVMADDESYLGLYTLKQQYIWIFKRLNGDFRIYKPETEVSHIAHPDMRGRGRHQIDGQTVLIDFRRL